MDATRRRFESGSANTAILPLASHCRAVWVGAISIRMHGLLFHRLIMPKPIYFLLLQALFLSACGQKGPLYMEGHEPPGQKVAKPAKPKTETAPELEPAAPN